MDSVHTPWRFIVATYAIWTVVLLPWYLTAESRWPVFLIWAIGGLLLPYLTKWLLRKRGYDVNPWAWKW
jgi:hypothetical protein